MFASIWIPSTSTVSEESQPARSGIKNSLKMLLYSCVHFALSPVLALSHTRPRLFQQAAGAFAVGIRS